MISLFIFQFVAAVAFLSSLPSHAASEADLYFGTEASRGKLFDSYVKQIEGAGVINSEAIQRRLGVPLSAELKNAKELFINAKSKDDVYFALLSLKNSFHDAHSNLDAPDDLESDNRVTELPFVAGVRDGIPGGARDGISGVEGHPIFYVERSESADLPVGSEILSTDGLKMSEQLIIHRRWLDNSSPEQLLLQTAEWIAKRQSWKIPSRKPGELTSIEFKTPKGEVKKIQLPWRLSSEKSYGDTCVVRSLAHSFEYAKEKPIFKGLNYCVYKFSNTLVIRYFSFFYNFSPIEIWERVPFLSFKVSALPRAKPFYQEIQDLDQINLREILNKNKPSTLIIDVRENMGGNISSPLLAIFAKEKFQLLKRQMIFSPKIRADQNFFNQSISLSSDEMTPLIKEDLKNKKSKASRLFPFFCLTTWCSEKEAEIEPDRTVHKSNVVVVTSPRCMSSCDQFVAIMQDSHIAKVAGLSSRGGHSPFRADVALKLHNGSVFKVGVTTGLGFRSNGVSLDGHPATPDIKIGPEGFSISEMVSRVEKFLKP